MCRDHPRTCGEKQFKGLNQNQQQGSPPHMRGKAGRLRGLQAGTGITPAHAGKSICSLRLNMLHRDHPRTCGEKFDRFLPSFIALGSPPHLRGKGFLYFAHEMLEVDHPRTCGEKKLAQFEDETGTGSPPHMRGKDGCAVALAHGDRITPAHAGKRAVPRPHLAKSQDHPRTCGEKQVDFSEVDFFPGSPPHMRGKGQSRLTTCGLMRITPAHAGKSHQALKYAVKGARITPAHAGKRGIYAAYRCGPRDHPRTCGEKQPLTPSTRA